MLHEAPNFARRPIQRGPIIPANMLPKRFNQRVGAAAPKPVVLSRRMAGGLRPVALKQVWEEPRLSY